MQFTRLLVVLLLSIYSQFALATLPIQLWQTTAGTWVYFVESRGLPILDISVDFDAGSSTDTPETSGRANLTLQLLSLGAGGLSEDQIAKSLADVGAELGGRFDQDRAGVSLRTLSSTRERNQALDILGRVIQRPEFPEDVLERERTRVITGLKDADTKPDHIASHTLKKMLYGSHPYGLRSSGEIASLELLQRKDLLDLYQSRYLAASAVISIMGDVSRVEAAAIAEALTRDLPQGKLNVTLPAVAAPVAETRRITHPASQSHIILAYPGLRRDDPDFFPLVVGNYILGGGGFVSRLMQEIRQNRGLAYSVYSSFSPLRQEGPFEIGLQTKKEQSEESLRITQQVLTKFIESGPTQKELIAAKQNIIGGFPLRLDSNKKIVDHLAMIGFYNLPLTYLDDYVKAIGKVTTLQVKKAFQRRIKPEGMVTVVVGAVENK